MHHIYQGDSDRLEFRLLDSNGAPEDLTNVTLKWGLSDPDEIDTPILEKTEGSGITVTDAAEGRCYVTISAGDLDTPGTYTHELEGAHASGATYTYGQGTLIVRPTVFPT